MSDDVAAAARVNALTRRQLDLAQPQPIFVSGVCHMKSEQLVFYLGGMIAVRCRTCNKHVCNVVLDAGTQEVINKEVINEEPVRLKSRCHPSAGIFIAYANGELTVACGKCKHKVTTLGVRASETGEA